ncbi:MAG: hypothetical protein NZ772_17345, partial [Cyanobacteria bacterium]|nr:hypothetical protein [Cyanobacteriota bacterium]
TRLACDRPYPNYLADYIECELTQADETGSAVTTKIVGLQAAKVAPAATKPSDIPYPTCQVVLLNHAGEQVVPLSENFTTINSQCTQAKKLEQRINYFVQDHNVRFLTLEEDNRHDPVLTWWVAASVWGATVLLIALLPTALTRVDRWEFDRLTHEMTLTRRWLWQAQVSRHPFQTISDVRIVEEYDRWQRPRYSLQLHLRGISPLILLHPDYGPLHRDRCYYLCEQIQQAIA